MAGHKHQHTKPAHRRWDNFVQGVENVAMELNPFKDGDHAPQARSPKTVTVFTTMSADFAGPIAGFTTIGVPAHPTQKPDSGDKATDGSFKETPAPKPDPGAKGSADDLPESLAPTKSIDLDSDPTLATAGTTSLTQATGHPQLPTALETTGPLSPTVVPAAPASPTATSTSRPSSSGTNTGMKAGIALGVIGGVLVVGLLIFFIFSKRKKQVEKRRPRDNEKVNGPPAGVYATPNVVVPDVAAPQLSLRPVTQFNPNFNERRSSKGAGLMLATAGATSHNAAHQRSNMRERVPTSNVNSPQNPFSDSARPSSPAGNRSAVPRQQASNPFDSPEHVVGVAQTTDLHAGPDASVTTGTGAVTVPTAAAAAAVAAAGGASLARKESIRKQAPEPLDLTIPTNPPSPTGTEYSMQSLTPGQSPALSKSAAAIAEAGGPASTAVHRVQLDFVPSMDDELELQAGHLVRILHEYDDGWALCIRLDRSQQGVVPRTCLSTRPVKPRPAGGPPASRNGGPPVNRPQGPRGAGPNYPPNYPQGRPESPMRPHNGRPQSPAQARPYSPAGGRPMSPHTGHPASPSGGPPMNPGPRMQPPGPRAQSPGPRAQSPGPRAQSPGPRAQSPQSPAGTNRLYSPPGPSPMNPNSPPGAAHQYRGSPGPSPQGQADRKFVPGQAY
ncbi:hypothetical protein GGR50DRAFT_404862 [Xylaria sp. CBS 124048]|nr:hypothetical protein GGR50DRAFT_404862 [Xylaria sp. CBS 124048]